MKVKRKVQVEQEQIRSVVCNKCGKECVSANKWGPDYDSVGPHVNVHVTWGYGSRKDLTMEDADLCEDCWDEFIATFKIPVEVKGYYPGR